MNKRIISVMLLIFMCATLLPCFTFTVMAASYDVDAAIAYAQAHWDDNVGLCAEFVSKCVRAGGIDIPVIATVTNLRPALTNATGLQFVELGMTENGRVTKAINGDNLQPGDVVIQYCYDHNIAPHVLLFGGYDSNGLARYYAHNGAMNMGDYDFRPGKNYYYRQHTPECNMGPKVIRLSALDVNSAPAPAPTPAPKPEIPSVISVSWAECFSPATVVSDNNAIISKTADLNGVDASIVSLVGIELYHGNGFLFAGKEAVPKSAGTKIDMYFDVKNDLGCDMLPNTAYSYKFYVVINNTRYYSDSYQLITGPDNGYNVSFYGNGGEVSISNKIVANYAPYGDLPVATRKGYTFTGWYTEPECEYLVTSDTLLNISYGLNLYAGWEKNSGYEDDDRETEYDDDDFSNFDTITIYLDANGGICSKKKITATVGERISNLPVPTRSGYIFDGWYSDEEYGYTKVGINTVINLTENVTLYAQWKKDNYKFPFADVRSDDWFYNDVKNAHTMGLINGKSSNAFKPDDYMTYAEAIKLAACMHQLYYEGDVTLSGSGEKWYRPYVDYAEENGIPTCDEFELNDNISRGDYVYIFYFALPESCYNEINDINKVPDVSSFQQYANAVKTFYRAGILTGTDEDGNFKPKNPIQRSEVATILSRMIDNSQRKFFSLSY